MTDIDQRLEKLEGDGERVIVILEGEPIYDIRNKNITGYSGGMVKLVEQSAELVEQSAEQLVLIENRLGRIETRMTTTRPPWTRGQKITLFGVGAPFMVGLLSSFWTTVVAIATWIVRL